METAARDHFNRQAEQYNERWASWTDETLRRMIELAEPRSDAQVLDVATGTGFTALAFAAIVKEVVGLDVSPGMLAQAEKRAAEKGIENVRWVEAPAEKLPFEDGSFDLVTVRVAPHHFESVPAFLSETKRVLKSGGVFVLGDTTVPDDSIEAADWQNAAEKARDASHVANLSPETWRRLTIEAGLDVTHVECVKGAIPIPLEAWLETAGCVGERADSVRGMFANAPESAKLAYQIREEPDGETRFAWQRVILRACKH